MDMRTIALHLGRGLLLLLGVGSWIRPAEAQPGEHVNLGEAELIPKVEIGSVYSSNVYLQEIDEQAGVALKLTPSAELTLESPELDLDLRGAYHFLKYLDPNLTNLDRYKDGLVDLDLGILPKALVGLDLEETFKSSSRASEATHAGSALIVKVANDLGGFLAFHPGGALEVKGGGRFIYEDYRVPPEVNIEQSPFYNSRIAYGPALEGKWRFFPRTAVVLQGRLERFTWDDNLVNIQESLGISEGDYGNYIGVPDGSLWSVQGGLRGRITERVAINALVGYTSATYDEATVLEDGANEQEASVDLDAASQGFDRDSEGIEGLSALVALDYNLDEMRRISLGYDRGLRDSYFTNFFVYDYVFLRAKALLSSRLGVAAEGGYRYESFFGEINRQDHVVRVRGDITYAGSDWLSVGAGAGWDRRASANEIATVEFDDVQVHVEMSLTY